MSFTFGLVFARFLREDFIVIKNKEWNAGKKPEEKSLRSTLAYFKGDYFFKTDNDFTIQCGEFYFNAVVAARQ